MVTGRSKLREWVRRYLPAEIAGTICEFGGAAIAYAATGSLGAAAIVATIAASAGQAIDSIAIRPVAFYLGPLMFSNVIAGWIFGKLVSDLAFYLCAIFSYERFNGLLARRQPDAEEVARGSVPAVAAA